MSDSEATQNDIGLADFLRGLRAEIEAAVVEGSKSDVRFKPGPIDVELQIQAERKGGANAKVEFKVFGTGATLGANGDLKSGRTQTLKMRLDVVLGPSSDGLISGRSGARNR